jgi:peptide/nickel transport system ATP-binding protein
MVNRDVILSVADLKTSFATDFGRVFAVDGVSFAVERGQTIGIVGESGSGKTVTLLSIMGLLPRPAGRIDYGTIQFSGTDLAKAPPSKMCKIRGRRMAMIFQEPMTALNPIVSIGRQLGECYRLHFPELTKHEVRRRCRDLLEQVGINAPDERLSQYPGQLSGGMRQRVMIAMALACKPDILFADEPTTALDVTIQAQILELIRQLQRTHGMAVVYVTHAMGVVAEVCDQVIVMYGGKIVEEGKVAEVFAKPLHPYTKGLLAAIPRLDSQRKTHLPVIEGTVPGIGEFGAGCRFMGRCKMAEAACATADPKIVEAAPGHRTACRLWKELAG